MPRGSGSGRYAALVGALTQFVDKLLCERTQQKKRSATPPPHSDGVVLNGARRLIITGLRSLRLRLSDDATAGGTDAEAHARTHAFEPAAALLAEFLRRYEKRHFQNGIDGKFGGIVDWTEVSAGVSASSGAEPEEHRGDVVDKLVHVIDEHDTDNFVAAVAACPTAVCA